jgi:hypothetical protein
MAQPKERKEMKLSRCFVLAGTVTAIVGLSMPFGSAQDGVPNSQATPAISGSGNAGHIAIWKNSATLGNSMLIQSGGHVGIGTVTPGSKLDVAGDINFSGSIRYQGNVLIQLPGGNSGFNVGLGPSALGVGTTGNSNTAVGFSALQLNGVGSNNTAVGVDALGFNGSGSNNTAIGVAALQANDSGEYNTATGLDALFSNTKGSGNTATGFGTLSLNSTGSNNTATGYGALSSVVGSNNTATGWQALTRIASGTNNIALGYLAGFNVSNASNNIHIGNQGSTSDNATIRVGDPTLHMSFFAAGIRGVMTANNDAVPVLVDSAGQLGTISSSRRYKEDIKDMGGASDGLMRLRPVTFRYTKPFDDGSKPIQFGLVAEEVAEVYPDLVVRSADGQLETVKYQLLDPMLLNELQKQNATIEAQKEEIRDQRQQIHGLEERLTKIEAAFERMAVTSSR